jgi:ribosomal protein S8E
VEKKEATTETPADWKNDERKAPTENHSTSRSTGGAEARELDRWKKDLDRAVSLGNLGESPWKEWPEEALLKTRVRGENRGRVLDSTSAAVAVDVANKEEGGRMWEACAANPKLREIVKRGIKSGQLLYATNGRRCSTMRHVPQCDKRLFFTYRHIRFMFSILKHHVRRAIFRY